MNEINVVKLTLTFIRSVGSILTNLIQMIGYYLPVSLVPLFLLLFSAGVIFRVIGRE